MSGAWRTLLVLVLAVIIAAAAILFVRARPTTGLKPVGYSQLIRI